MKKILIASLVTMAGFCLHAWAAETKAAESSTMSYVEARAQIDKIINSSSGAEMAAVISKLQAADQRQFLADVNKAIGELPGSVEEKSAKALNINHAAVKAAKKGNAMAMLAEVFATAQPEALTVITESFAANLLNRSANPKVAYSDAQYTNIAVNVMKAVHERLKDSDSASARSVFAMIMLIRASNGSPADLAETLISTLSDKDAQEMARTEWIPSALGKNGRELGYEPLLASANAGRRPDLNFVLSIAGPQRLDALLSDITGKSTDPNTPSTAETPISDAGQSDFFEPAPY